nr:hypothetical protein [Stenotrophomonas maltophilia]
MSISFPGLVVPDTSRNGDRIGEGEPVGAYCLSKPLSDLYRVFCPDPWQNHQEFLSTNPAKHVARSGTSLHAVGDSLNRPISCGMAVTVIYIFKMIKIEGD